MGAFEIVGSLIALAVIVIIVWRVLAARAKETDAVMILDGSISGKQAQTGGANISRSFNQDEGATFTYSGWILVNDFTHNYGRQRTIFTKGDCPGLYLDTTSNSLKVVINTFAAVPESLLIQNIPANKWVHFAIVVDQDSVDVYINGIISQHHSLSQLPKQNDASVTMGATGPGGWDGVLANLQYNPRSLSAAEIGVLAVTVPKDDLRGKPAGPQYFDLSWYTGRT
jgi:hypothetical protein